MEWGEHAFFRVVNAFLRLGILQGEHRVLQCSGADMPGNAPLGKCRVVVHPVRRAYTCAQCAAIEDVALECVGYADALCNEQHKGRRYQTEEGAFQQCQSLVRVFGQLVFELKLCDGRVGVFWRVGVKRFQALPILG